MKFGQVIQYNKRNIFIEISAGNEGGRLVRDFFCLFKKVWYEVKASGVSYKLIVLNLAYSKCELYKTLDYCSPDTLNFDFLEKGLEIVSPSHFMYGFSRKMYLVLFSINWPNFVAWLPLLLEIFIVHCVYSNCF